MTGDFLESDLLFEESRHGDFVGGVQGDGFRASGLRGLVG